MRSASERALRLRARPDLVIQPQVFADESFWLVKDPVSLKYFHLRKEEHAILSMLDGRTTLTALRERFETQFAPMRLPLEQLYVFLGQMHELGLLLADAHGQGARLLERRELRQKRAWWTTLGQVLAIRLPGIDPERLLQILDGPARVLLSPLALAVWCTAILAALGLVIGRFAVVQERLPDFHAFFTPGNVIWLAVALVFTKILHELGHAMVCRKLGGECHEIGLLLLVFTPCLYCNVTDAWSFPNRWHRMAVAAAGIGVELLLAALAVFVWWKTAPGLLNTLALNIVVVCSVSTLFINGNPLLRYDGYYVFADWLEVPNLGQQSQEYLEGLLAWIVFGLPMPPSRMFSQGRRGVLVLYGIASTLYRWFVLLAILWFFQRLLVPRGLTPIFQLLAYVVLAGAIAAPAIRWTRRLTRSSNLHIRRGRATIWLCVVLAIVGGIFFVPTPQRIAARAVIEPRDARRVYVVVPGRIESAVPLGKSVAAGDMLAQLVDLDLDREIVELEGRCRRLEVQLKNLRLLQSDSLAMAGQIPSTETALHEAQQRLAARRRDRDRLVLRAPVAGVVLEPPRRPAEQDAGQLAAWHGHPLDPRNRGALLEEGTLLCLIGPPADSEGMLLIDQGDLGMVSPGERVRLRIDSVPGKVLTGVVDELATSELKTVSHALAKAADLPVRIDEQGAAHPLSATYEARVRLDDPAVDLPIGSHGSARIAAAWEPLYKRMARMLQQSFPSLF